MVPRRSNPIPLRGGFALPQGQAARSNRYRSSFAVYAAALFERPIITITPEITSTTTPAIVACSGDT